MWRHVSPRRCCALACALSLAGSAALAAGALNAAALLLWLAICASNAATLVAFRERVWHRRLTVVRGPRPPDPPLNPTPCGQT